MSHDHSSHARRRMSPQARRLTLSLLIPAVLLTALGMLLLWPGDTARTATPEDGPSQVNGQVVAVTPEECLPLPDGEVQPPDVKCGSVTVRVTSGDAEGTEVRTDIPAGPGAPVVEAGDDMVLLVLEDEAGGNTYSIMDYQRTSSLWVIGAAFALAVIAFGRWRGVFALAGLGVTFAVLLFFIVPAILDGRNPLLVAIVGAAAIMLTVLYLTHGFTTTTSVAVAGTLISLTLTAGLSAAATAAAHLSGVADETSNFLTITQSDVNMQGLLLAGIVIGSLGVLDDVTVTQSHTVDELALANPAYGFGRLYAAATRVGRAHIASVINTIVLAYAGASLPLMLLFATGDTPISELLTGQLIAQELIRSAVGTIGLIAAVPITTALAALIAVRTRPAPASSSHPAPVASGPDRSAADRPAPDRAAADRHAADRPASHRPVAGQPQPGSQPTPPPAEDRWAAFVDRDRDRRD